MKIPSLTIQTTGTVFLFSMLLSFSGYAQIEKQATDSNTPLHLLQPYYPVPYGLIKKEEVKVVIDRVRDYLTAVTPTTVIDKTTQKEIPIFQK